LNKDNIENLKEQKYKNILIENQNQILNKFVKDNIEEIDLSNEREFIKNNSSEILDDLLSGIEFTESISSTFKEKSKYDVSISEEKITGINFLHSIKHKILKEEKFFLIGTKSFKLIKNECENEISDQKFFKDELNLFNNILKNKNDNNLNNLVNYNDINYLKPELKNEEDLLYFDINIRYYKNQDEENFEIVLNDVTKFKLNENKNAEFKYKTIFLSKVAHEFKNPLICIIELIDQLIDLNNKLMKKDLKIINELTSQIKGISNYLLILVKDLDYFSITQSKINYNLEYEKCNLDEIVKFIFEMGTILLKKAQKDEKINFIIKKDPNLNVFITTDEIKLKQVLVNLLSNSVKFTYNGEIKLEIKKNPINAKNVDFILKDTGIGMKEEKKNISLFKKNFDKTNNMGAGLGLYIIDELTNQLGTQINIISEFGKGSEFRFTLINKDAFLNKKLDLDTQICKNIGNKIETNFKHKLNFSKKNYNKSPSKFKCSATFNKDKNYIKENLNFFEYNPILIKTFEKFESRSQCIQSKKENYLDISISQKTKKKSENNYFFNHNIFFLQNDKYNLNHPHHSENWSLNEFPNIYNDSNLVKSQSSLCCMASKANEFSECEAYEDEIKIKHLNKKIRESNINELKLIKNNYNVKEFVNDKNNYRLNNENEIFFTNNGYYSDSIQNINQTNGDPVKLSNTIEILSEKISNSKTNLKKVNLIITDDEDLTRKSTIRMIRKNFEMNNLNSKYELVIYEAKDGLDCLAKFYNMIIEGIEVYSIISDESMYFLNGSECSVIIDKVIKKREMKKINYYLITAFPKENFTIFLKKSKENIYNKPINFSDVNEIFQELIFCDFKRDE